MGVFSSCVCLGSPAMCSLDVKQYLMTNAFTLVGCHDPHTISAIFTLMERIWFFVFTIKKEIPRQAPVAHACTPSYLRGRDQEDCSSKPAQGNSS
jgi:hypothetical protein